MSNSVSTGKLEIVENIISNLKESLNDMKMNQIKTIEIDWQEIETSPEDCMPCPRLRVDFFE